MAGYKRRRSVERMEGSFNGPPKELRVMLMAPRSARASYNFSPPPESKIKRDYK